MAYVNYGHWFSYLIIVFQTMDTQTFDLLMET